MVDAEDVEVGEVDMREARDGLRREGGAGGVTREKGGRGERVGRETGVRREGEG